MSYTTLNEAKRSGKTVAYPICSKFCSIGVVTSYSWNQTFLVVSDGFVRLYDSEETYNTEFKNFVQEIYVTDDVKTSQIKSKNISKVQGIDWIIHAFYIEMDNGFWMPQRLIKVGSFDIGVVQALKASIDRLRTSDTVS